MSLTALRLAFPTSQDWAVHPSGIWYSIRYHWLLRLQLNLPPVPPHPGILSPKQHTTQMPLKEDDNCQAGHETTLSNLSPHAGQATDCLLFLSGSLQPSSIMPLLTFLPKRHPYLICPVPPIVSSFLPLLSCGRLYFPKTGTAMFLVPHTLLGLWQISRDSLYSHSLNWVELC